MLLSDDERARFARDGVLVLRQAIPAELLDDLRARARRIRELAERDGVHGVRIAPGHAERLAADPDARHGLSWGVNEITRPALHDPPLVDVMALPRVRGCLDGLLDQPRAWGLKILWAPRLADYELHWHRDLDAAFDAVMPFKPARNDHVQFNACLTSDPAFIVVPGSHRRRMTPAERAGIAADRRGPLPGEQRIALGPGDVLFMDAHALHRGCCPAGHERISLHFSCQAQWVPLKPWGRSEDFRWICSDAFRATLRPETRPYYERLTSARLDLDHQYSYLVEQAKAAGWVPPPDWAMPGQEPYRAA